MRPILPGMDPLAQHLEQLQQAPESYRPGFCPYCGKQGLWVDINITRTKIGKNKTLILFNGKELNKNDDLSIPMVVQVIIGSGVTGCGADNPSRCSGSQDSVRVSGFYLRDRSVTPFAGFIFVDFVAEQASHENEEYRHEQHPAQRGADHASARAC